MELRFWRKSRKGTRETADSSTLSPETGFLPARGTQTPSLASRPVTFTLAPGNIVWQELTVVVASHFVHVSSVPPILDAMDVHFAIPLSAISCVERISQDGVLLTLHTSEYSHHLEAFKPSRQEFTNPYLLHLQKHRPFHGQSFSNVDAFATELQERIGYWSRPVRSLKDDYQWVAEAIAGSKRGPDGLYNVEPYRKLTTMLLYDKWPPRLLDATFNTWQRHGLDDQVDHLIGRYGCWWTKGFWPNLTAHKPEALLEFEALARRNGLWPARFRSTPDDRLRGLVFDGGRRFTLERLGVHGLPKPSVYNCAICGVRFSDNSMEARQKLGPQRYCRHCSEATEFPVIDATMSPDHGVEALRRLASAIEGIPSKSLLGQGHTGTRSVGVLPPDPERRDLIVASLMAVPGSGCYSDWFGPEFES